MNTKNFNVFEVHVEKLVLALAVLGAGYLGFVAFQPQTVSYNGKQVNLDQVESVVEGEMNKLEIAKRATLELGPLKVNVPDYANDFKKKSEEPLDKRLLTTAIPSFVPHQAGVSHIDISTSKIGSGIVKVPTVPKPKDLGVVAHPFVRQLLAGEVPAAGEGAPPPVVPAPAVPAGGAAALPAPQGKDDNIVVLWGILPVGEFTNVMKNVAQVEQCLPREWQKTVVYKIEVQRRSKALGETWSGWEDMPPATSPPAPANAPFISEADLRKIKDRDVVDPMITQVQQQQNKIIQPDSYNNLDGKPVLETVLPAEMRGLVSKSGSTGVPTPAPVTPAPPTGREGPMPGPGPGPMPGPGIGPSDLPPGPAGTAGPTGVPAPAATPMVVNADNLAFWVVDDHVQPGTEYQYRVRLVMFNPTFDYTFNGRPGKLEDPAKRDEPTLRSDWVEIGRTAAVPANMYVFINPPLGNDSTITAQVFKWISGKWYVDHNASASAGMPLIASIRLGLDVRTAITVPTGFTLVDFVVSKDERSVRVILQTAEGELIERDSRTDKSVMENLKKDGTIKEPANVGPGPGPGPKSGTGTGTKSGTGPGPKSGPTTMPSPGPGPGVMPGPGAGPGPGPGPIMRPPPTDTPR